MVRNENLILELKKIKLRWRLKFHERIFWNAGKVFITWKKNMKILLKVFKMKLKINKILCIIKQSKKLRD